MKDIFLRIIAALLFLAGLILILIGTINLTSNLTQKNKQPNITYLVREV